MKLAGLSRFIGISLCAWGIGFLWAGEGNVRFRNLTVDDGLSQSSVYAMTQDSLGFMWFGTFDGLNRYDGYRFKVFQHDPRVPQSLAHDWVSSLAAGENGQVWVGTFGGGLDRYNPKTHSFEHFTLGSDPQGVGGDQVRAILVGRLGRIWLGTAKGLQQLDPATGKSISLDLPLAVKGDSRQVNALFEDGHGVWVGTNGGLVLLDQAGKVMRFDGVGPGPEMFKGPVRAITSDQAGQLWVGTEMGLDRVDPVSGARTHFENHPEDSGTLSSNLVRELLFDSGKRLWIATEKGLNLYLPMENQFRAYLNDPAVSESISGDEVHALFEDTTGMLWVGTHGGLSRWNTASSIFHHFAYDPNKPSLSNNAVMAFAEAPDNALWVGTFGGGLNRVDVETGAVETLMPSPKGLNDDRIGSLHVDRQGILWIGTFGSGLNRYDPKQKSFVYYRKEPNNPNSLGSDAVTSISESRNGKSLYVTTYRGGLNILDLATNEMRQFRHDPARPDSLPSDRLVSQCVDHRGLLWLGTNGSGFCGYLESSNSFITYTHKEEDPDSLNSNEVFCLYEDARLNMWIGGHSGLELWSAADRAAGFVRFTHFTRREGLADNLVYGIVPGEDHILWLSTGRGLSRLDTRDRSFRNFHTIHGLQADEFNAGAYFRSSKGQIFFGGVNGFNAFFPEDVKANPVPPKLVLIDLLLHNESAPIDEEDGPLSADLQFLDEVTLTYQQDVFAIEFSGLHFVDPSKNRYAYKLEGVDDAWVQVDSGKRFAAYTTLKSGNYQFRVKASNNDGVWDEEGHSLMIRIEPPPWRSWWAYALYTVLLSGALSGYVVYQRKSLAAKQRLIEQLTRVDRLKDDFLANTSHELRTPLGGIIGLAESLVDGAAGPVNETQHRHLNMLISSGRRLSALVDDILDFSKLRSAEVDLALKPVDIYTLVDVVLTLSKSSLGNKGLELINDLSPNLPAVQADENRLVQILHNLIGNAIKFTERGSVRVSAMEQDDFLHISIQDTGIGIEPSDHKRIFDSFHQLEPANERRHGGAGLGLAITSRLVELQGGQIWLNSIPNQGSTFSFSLPKACSAVEVRSMASGLLSGTRIQVEESAAEPSPSRNVVEPVPETRFTILIVDDEPVNRQVLKNHLSSTEYHLVEAVDGPEALELVAAQPVDLVLLDIMMPRMSGYEVCRILREQHHMHSLPIIFLTARNQLSDLSTGFSSGANDYLTKPIAKKELVARVRTHLALLDITRTLEQRVGERTRELERKNDEMRTLDRIVKTVNRELTLQRVLQVLLEQGMLLFENADKAAFILLDHQTQTFKIAASVGHDLEQLHDFEFKRSEILTRYTQDAEQVELGVYLVRNVAVLPGRDLPRPECLLSMAVTLDNVLEGFLVISNFSDKHAFDRSDVRKLVRYQEHAVSALAKARYLEELQAKNEEILRTQNQLILREKMVSLGTLTAGIAHEIRNPLNFINNFGVLNTDLVNEGLELLQSKGNHLDPITYDHMREILRGLGENCSLIDKHGKKANHIVQSMMMFSREGVGQREPYRINDLVEEYVNLAYSGMVARGELIHISFDRNYDEAVGILHVVVPSLGRVILSLVTNAIESLLEKQLRNREFMPMLWVSTQLVEHTVVIRIKDNGLGIPESIRDKVFTPFFTTRESENNIGLGLFISYDMIVQEHHGSLAIDSSEGEFCEFTIRLPQQ